MLLNGSPNSLKYAFPDNGEGEVNIGLQTDGQKGVELTVGDNDIGMPRDFIWQTADSLGLSPVQLLAKRQLDGAIELKRDHGTIFVAKFKP